MGNRLKTTVVHCQTHSVSLPGHASVCVCVSCHSVYCGFDPVLVCVCIVCELHASTQQQQLLYIRKQWGLGALGSMPIFTARCRATYRRMPR